MTDIGGRSLARPPLPDGVFLPLEGCRVRPGGAAESRLRTADLRVTLDHTVADSPYASALWRPDSTAFLGGDRPGLRGVVCL